MIKETYYNQSVLDNHTKPCKVYSCICVITITCENSVVKRVAQIGEAVVEVQPGVQGRLWIAKKQVSETAVLSVFPNL